jgi:hypothetical protein
MPVGRRLGWQAIRYNAASVATTVWRRYDHPCIALLRAINNVALAYPDLASVEQVVAIPLRMLAGRWIALLLAICRAAENHPPGVTCTHDGQIHLSQRDPCATIGLNPASQRLRIRPNESLHLTPIRVHIDRQFCKLDFLLLDDLALDDLTCET